MNHRNAAWLLMAGVVAASVALGLSIAHSEEFEATEAQKELTQAAREHMSGQQRMAVERVLRTWKGGDPTYPAAIVLERALVALEAEQPALDAARGSVVAWAASVDGSDVYAATTEGELWRIAARGSAALLCRLTGEPTAVGVSAAHVLVGTKSGELYVVARSASSRSVRGLRLRGCIQSISTVGEGAAYAAVVLTSGGILTAVDPDSCEAESAGRIEPDPEHLAVTESRLLTWSSRGPLEVHQWPGLRSLGRVNCSEGAIAAADFIRGGDVVAVTRDGWMRRLSPTEGELLTVYEVSVGDVAQAYVDDPTVFTCGTDGVRLHGAVDGRRLPVRMMPSSGVCTHVLPAGGRRISVAGDDGNLRLFLVPSANCPSVSRHGVFATKPAHTPLVPAVAELHTGSDLLGLAAAGQRLVVFNVDRPVSLWDLKLLTGAVVWEGGEACAAVKHLWRGIDRTPVLAMGSDDLVRCLDAADPLHARTLGDGSHVSAACLSVARRSVVLATHSGFITEWGLAPGEPISLPVGARGVCTKVCDAGEAIGCGFYDGTVLLWKPSAGVLADHTFNVEGPVSALAAEPSRGLLFAAGQGTDAALRMMGLDSREIVWGRTVPDAAVTSCAFHPAGRSILVGLSTGDVLELATSNGQILQELRHGDSSVHVAWSSCGTRMSIWSSRAGLRILSDGRPIMRSPIGVGGCVAWSPSSPTLAAGGVDGEIAVWDGRSGELLTELRGHGALVWDVLFSADGSSLYSAGDDGSVRRWKLGGSSHASFVARAQAALEKVSDR